MPIANLVVGQSQALFCPLIVYPKVKFISDDTLVVLRHRRNIHHIVKIHSIQWVGTGNNFCIINQLQIISVIMKVLRQPWLEVRTQYGKYSIKHRL